MPSPTLIGDIERTLWPNTVTVPFALDAGARARHCYIVGQTGVGKSNLIENMIAQDLARGHGVAVLDPHGPLAEAALAAVPKTRHNQVIHIDPTDPCPVGFNLLATATPATAPRLAAVTVETFVHIFGESSVGPASQDILSNAVRALMCTPGSTLLGVLRLLDDANYRDRIADRVTDPVIRHFWHTTVPSWSQQMWLDVTKPIANKLRAVLGDPRARHIVGQRTSTFDLARAMDEGHILIANLSTRLLGEPISHLIGALLTAAITMTALARDPARNPRPFFFFADEFQVFANSAFETILSQSRKMGLNLTLAHQFLTQLPSDLSAAILGNAGTTIAFRVGAEDAPLLARHMGLDQLFELSEFKGHQQLLQLKDYHAFVKTLEDGAPATWRLRPYQAAVPDAPRSDAIKANSRAQFGRLQAAIEAQIDAFYAQRARLI